MTARSTGSARPSSCSAVASFHTLRTIATLAWGKACRRYWTNHAYGALLPASAASANGLIEPPRTSTVTSRPARSLRSARVWSLVGSPSAMAAIIRTASTIAELTAVAAALG
ncbi:MAG: hypothetical protein HQ592_06510 [Planctomycetes bacterium]|nr:hypothetical protein [Planctomycetota bacterium]